MARKRQLDNVLVDNGYVQFRLINPDEPPKSKSEIGPIGNYTCKEAKIKVNLMQLLMAAGCHSKAFCEFGGIPIERLVSNFIEEDIVHENLHAIGIGHPEGSLQGYSWGVGPVPKRRYLPKDPGISYDKTPEEFRRFLFHAGLPLYNDMSKIDIDWLATNCGLKESEILAIKQRKIDEIGTVLPPSSVSDTSIDALYVHHIRGRKTPL